MKTVNFKEFSVWTDIDATEPAVEDMRRMVADAIYKNMIGIVAHDLAFRILRSEGAIELSPEDEELLRDFFANTKAWMYGSYMKNVTKEGGDE